MLSLLPASQHEMILAYLMVATFAFPSGRWKVRRWINESENISQMVAAYAMAGLLGFTAIIGAIWAAGGGMNAFERVRPEALLFSMVVAAGLAAYWHIEGLTYRRRTGAMHVGGDMHRNVGFVRTFSERP